MAIATKYVSMDDLSLAEQGDCLAFTSITVNKEIDKSAFQSKLLKMFDLLQFIKNEKNPSFSFIFSPICPLHVKKNCVELLSYESGANLPTINMLINFVYGFYNLLNINFIYCHVNFDVNKMNRVWRTMYLQDKFNMEKVLLYASQNDDADLLHVLNVLTKN